MNLQNKKIIRTRDSIAVIFDDHILFADSFSAIIERLKLFQSVQTFSREEDLLDFIVNNHKSSLYIFLDYYIYDKNSLMLLNEIKRINKSSRIIFCSSVQTLSIVRNVLTYQPEGFISKSSGIDIVLECVKNIENGQFYTCPVITSMLSQYQENEKAVFTTREIDILQYFAQGMSIAETAESTFLNKHTIIVHRRNMMGKANCRSITELLAYARKRSLV